MRQILFRGKRIDDGQWVYGSLLQWPDGSASISYSVDGCDLIEVEVVPESVGQFTGRTANDGTKIFEDDLLSGHSDGIVRVVYVDDGYEGIFNDKGNIPLAELWWFKSFVKVEGNIHDNPESLTQ